MVFESAWYEYRDTSMPKYVKLYYCIRREIERGNMKPGSKLPSIRQVSKELGLSSTTVENAYNQLMVEGYIYSVPQKGYFAASLDPSFINVDGFTVKKEERHEDIRLKDDFLDTEIFNFNEWRKIYNVIIRDFRPRLLTEGDPRGEFELRQALADYTYKARGVVCSPDQIIIGSGVQSLLHVFCDIAAGMVRPEVAFEEPGFVDVRPVFLKRGYKLHPISLDKDGINIRSLVESNAAVCYTSPSHQYPTGLVMPVQKRMELIKWADGSGGFILEDDYDSELRLFGRPVPSLYSLDSSGRVVYIGSFSTVIAPSLRISYMILPDCLNERYKDMAKGYRSTVSTAEQLVLAEYIVKGLYARHLRRMRKKCSEKLKLLYHAAGEFKGLLKIHPSDTGTFVLVETPGMRKSVDIEAFSEYLTGLWDGFYVFNYAAVRPEKYKEILGLLI
ncbi:transcriptional regulator, GntR family [Thermoclostridium stercorarium subsp. stercorarium DSM 8532]|uniref:Transcriptional regulator, GntR family n=2 Tax=Thermoclostridium stercorarium TaxID=1510 RepID=L7VQV3_THES1|nr:PLP-dependent aminotransferase family protein [Thermoclostridium stercorarium]AGC67953.1 transcriptional regulator, GntR family [Thermoclostridium stercorarium subsp. stercorarium DSM 8532]AGI38989.1 transcriptional regulator [Thermoclostridium stercorarium subsp. stercorarium DSM 8532]ANW98355.1 GntR family transcriptional regulator [Thermoclostridium stercorarium subsp. thermolacticum DSM 2910]